MLLIFIILASLKGFVEYYAYTRRNHTSKSSSQRISFILILIGSLLPIAILAEILFLHHSLSLGISLIIAVFYILLLAGRILSIHTLGSSYSVDALILPHQKLITNGIYRYFRHPIYLIGIFESFIYPLACGAWLTAILFFLISTPVLLLRRQQEEKLLIKQFKQKYLDYISKTIW